VSDRELILTRIRDALGDVPSSEPEAWIADLEPDAEATYVRGQTVQADRLVEMFIERCEAYGAGVVLCEDESSEIAAAISAACARQSATRLVAPATLEPAWRSADLRFTLDEPALSAEQLDGFDGVLTG